MRGAFPGHVAQVVDSLGPLDANTFDQLAAVLRPSAPSPSRRKAGPASPTFVNLADPPGSTPDEDRPAHGPARERRRPAA